jgi:hypothetical protein
MTDSQDMVKHIDHELREFLRVGRLIQSGRYDGTELDAPLREAFASHFRKLCEFFGIQRLPGKFRDSKDTDYVSRKKPYKDQRIRRRMYDADKLQAHLSPGRIQLERKGAEWGERRDTDMFVAKVRRFVRDAEESGYSFDKTRKELTRW